MRFQILRLKEEFLRALPAMEQLFRDTPPCGDVYAQSARRSAIAFGRTVASLGVGGDGGLALRRRHAAWSALRALSMDLDMLLALGFAAKTHHTQVKRHVTELESILENIARIQRGAGIPPRAEDIDSHLAEPNAESPLKNSDETPT